MSGIPDTNGRLLAVERWFVRRGIPHFIADYRAATRVWTRAAYVFPVVYLAGALNAINRKYSLIANVAVFGAGCLR